MLKKICAGALCAALAAAALSGCGGEEKREGASAGGGDSFTYWCPMDPSIASLVQSMGEVKMYQELEKKTGVKINFIHPPAGQEEEQFSLMMASRDLPDMIEYQWVNYPGGPEKAIEDNVIYALNPYIESGAPNFKALISGEDPLSRAYDRGSKTDAGNYFSMPAFDVGEYRTFGGPMIRKDWLDELGLPVPETIGEWETALTAFRDKKGAKAPLTGIKYFYLLGGDSFNGAYDVGRGFFAEEGTVKFGPLETGFQDYLKLMRRWYQEGLLDNDFPTIDATIISSKITKGASGALMGYLGSAMGTYLKQMAQTDPSFNLVCAPYPTLEKGQTNRFMLMENDVENKYLAFTTACSNPEEAVRWADYFYGEEGYRLVNFGVEGESYNMIDGYPTYTDVILNNPNGYSVNEALGLYTRAAYVAPGLNQAEEYLEQYYQYPQQLDGFKMWAQHVDQAKTVKLPEGIIATSDESEEYAALKTDITTFVDEMLLKFIQGVEPIENYDAFIQKLRSTFHVDRYLELEQAMYDRYMSR